MNEITKTIKQDKAIWITLVLIVSVFLMFSSTSWVFGEEDIAPETDSTSEEGSDPQQESVEEEAAQEDETTQEEQPEETQTVIETGDAESQVNVESSVNTNIVNTDNGTSTPDEPSDEGATEQTDDNQGATSTPIVIDLAPEEETSTSTATSTQEITVSIENENTAVATTTASSTAETGDNKANENPGNVLINTGNAYAGANVVNVINTNIVDSHGFFVLMNLFSQAFGDIDLRGVDFTPGLGCNELSCTSLNSFDITNANHATTTNNIEVSAQTGQNESSFNEGGTVIRTGNAYAGANVVNVLNTNIVDSNYLLVTVNQFNSWVGDLVFPGQSFFNQILAPFFGFSNIVNNNYANIHNTVNASANTGNNDASGNSGESEIETGNAVSSVNVSNTVNTNLTGGTSVMILVKVHGNWTGDVFSAPPGVSWEETKDGLAIYGLNETGGLAGGGNSTIENNNSANLTNNINVVALTGENKANNNGEGSTIKTGNAAALTNAVNLVNTNIAGHNWVFALINIFGDWNGDVAFGRPDLWVGSSAEVVDPAWVGLDVNFKVLVANKGDADATDVYLKNIFDSNLLDVNGGEDSLAEKGSMGWNLGTIKAGEEKEVTFSASVTENIPWGDGEIKNEFTATSHETDNDVTDNVDTLSFSTHKYHPGGPQSVSEVYLVAAQGGGEPPKLTMERSSLGVSSIEPGGQIPMQITLKNESTSSAYDVIVRDFLVGEDAKPMAGDFWELGEVFPEEEIVIDYTLEINEKAAAGSFRKVAIADGFEFSGTEVTSNAAASDYFEIIREEVAIVESVSSKLEKVAGPPKAIAAISAPSITDRGIQNAIVLDKKSGSSGLLASMFDSLVNLYTALGAMAALLLLFLLKRRREEA